MVQYSFTSTKTRRLVGTDSPGRPPRLTQLLNYVCCPVCCPILYSWLPGLLPSPSWLSCLLLGPLWLPSLLPSPRSLPVPFGTSSVQFKLVLLCAQKSPHVLISFPNVAFETVLMLSDSLIDKGPYSSFEEDRQALSLSTPLLAISGSSPAGSASSSSRIPREWEKIWKETPHKCF